MTKTLNTPPGGYLLFKNDVWVNPDRLAITTQSRKFARFETRGWRTPARARCHFGVEDVIRIPGWRQMPDKRSPRRNYFARGIRPSPGAPSNSTMRGVVKSKLKAINQLNQSRHWTNNGSQI